VPTPASLRSAGATDIGSDTTDIAGAGELASAGPFQHDADVTQH
jgi:hypothetical protein